MGYAGATYIVQESATRCSTRCSTSCRSAPSWTGSRRRPSRLHAEQPWDDEAKALLDDCVETQPVLIRISAAKRLRERAERDARRAGEERVTAERVAQARAALMEGDAWHDRCHLAAIPMHAQQTWEADVDDR